MKSLVLAFAAALAVSLVSVDCASAQCNVQRSSASASSAADLQTLSQLFAIQQAPSRPVAASAVAGFAPAPSRVIQAPTASASAVAGSAFSVPPPSVSSAQLQALATLLSSPSLTAQAQAGGGGGGGGGRSSSRARTVSRTIAPRPVVTRSRSVAISSTRG